MIIVPTPSKSFVKNIVSRHAQGFKNTNNKDFFDHMFRMFLKNKALLDQKQTKQLFKSSTIYNQLPNDIMIDSQLPFNSPYFHSQNFDDKEYKILKIKDFVLKKSLMDLKMYKKLISLYYQENESTEESPSKYQLNQTKIPNLNIITLSPDYLKFPAQKKYLHEEVFILNIIEKVQIYGIKSLHQNEISLFQAILNQREIQIDQLSTELFESFQKISRSDKKYATLIAESSDSFRIDLLDSKKTTSEFQKSSAKLSCSSPKKTYSLGVLNPIVFQTTEENETIHKKKGKVGELIKKKEKLKPLTMISSEKNGDETSNILFGNMELVELNYRLEAAKKELVQRLDLIHIKEDLIEFKGESLWNIQANKTKNELSINMSKETKEKESEQKIQKTNLNSETPLKNPPEIKYSGMDFSSSDRKVLKEKTFLLKQNSTFNNLENLITEEAHPKFSGKGSVAKLHKFSEIKNKNQTEKSSLFKTGNILTSKIKIYKNEPLISNEKVKVLKELETPKIEKKMDKLKEIQEIMKENDIIILENLKRKQPVAEIIIEKKQDIVKSDQTQKILSILKDSSPKLQTLTKKKSSNHLLFTENDKKNILSPEENNDLFLKHEETPSIQVLIETNKDTTNESSSRTLKNLMTQPKNTINKPKKSIKAKDSILNLNCDFKKEPKESILLDNTPIKIILRQTSPPEENKDQINTSISVDEKQTNKKNSKIHHSRIKNSSFSKIAVTQKNLKETEIEEIKQNLEENQQVKFVFNLLSEDRIKKNTIESEFQQDNIFLKPENLEEDLDKLLMGDMASLDKRAMRLSQIINKNILNSTNHQNSIDSLSLPNAG